MLQFFHDLGWTLAKFRWQDVVDIVIVAFVIYQLILFIQGTKVVQALKGLLILILLFFIASVMGFETITWVLKGLVPIGVIAFLVVFHPEIRRALVHVGGKRLFNAYQEEEKVIEELVKATSIFSEKKIGALIVLEREVGLKNYIETGIEIDSFVTTELLDNIFAPNTPLHDGAVIVQLGRIAAAGCLLPLAAETSLSKNFGTRHLAAIGLTQETDAVVVIVSEETGATSIALGGKLIHDLDSTNIRKTLRNLYASAAHRRISPHLRKSSNKRGLDEREN